MPGSPSIRTVYPVPAVSREMSPMSRPYSLLRPTKGVVSLVAPMAESGGEGSDVACSGGASVPTGVVQSQTVRGVQRACRIEEIAPLLLGYGERHGEPFSEPPRGATLVGLDLSDGETRAADPLGERLLGEIQRLAPPP